MRVRKEEGARSKEQGARKKEEEEEQEEEEACRCGSPLNVITVGRRMVTTMLIMNKAPLDSASVSPVAFR